MESLTYDYLFEDKYIFERLGREKFYNTTYPILISRGNKKSTHFLKSLLNGYENIQFRLRRSTKCNILILDFKFEKMISELSEDYNIYVVYDSLSRYKEYKSKLSTHIYFPHLWMKLINSSFFSQDMGDAAEAISQIKAFMKKNHLQLLLVGNDKLFIEKALIYAAKQLEIPVIIIQHGVYNVDSFRSLYSAKEADYFWCWSQYIKDMYINFYGGSEDRVKVVGYPFEVKEKINKNGKYILFLGNQYSNFDKDEGIRYLNIAKDVYKICRNNNLTFVYRPHPAEIIDDSYGELLDTNIMKGIPLISDLMESSVIIGDISSVMVEAGIMGCPVIQIIWSERSKIGVIDPMYSFTVKVRPIYDEMEKAILSLITGVASVKIDSYYLLKNDNFISDVKTEIRKIAIPH